MERKKFKELNLSNAFLFAAALADEEKCLENNRLLGDGTVKIFLNIKRENSHEVPKALVEFLKYVENSTDTRVNESSDTNLQKLHEKVLKLKESRELEENFMYLTEWLEEEMMDVQKHVISCLT